MGKQEPIIYGVRTGDTYHYIGKTSRKKVNLDDSINKSEIQAIYNRSKLKEFAAGNSDISVVKIMSSSNGEWYDEKLGEVVKKHAENHPLLNSQWMLDGQRGYWGGKTRDANTLQQLSESKYKKILQYDKDGNLFKQWDSIKEAATIVFGDYRVIKGSAISELYVTLGAATIKGRFKKNSYWFKESELKSWFNCIPKRINVNLIAENQHNARSQSMREKRRDNPNKTRSRYTVIQYNPDMTIMTTFDNTDHAAYELKTSRKVIERYCKGVIKNSVHILKYGEKKSQKIQAVYPDYIPQKILILPEQKIKKHPTQRVCTRTRTTVEWYVFDKLFFTFDNVLDAARHFHVHVNIIRRVIHGKRNKFQYDIRLGEKKQIIV